MNTCFISDLKYYATRYRETWNSYWTLESWGLEHEQFPLEKKSLKSEQSQPMFLISSEASAFPNDITRASIINQYKFNDNLRVSLQDQARSWVLKRWYSRPFQVVREAIISCTQNIIIIINHVNKIQSDYYSSWNRRSWYFWLKWDN